MRPSRLPKAKPLFFLGLFSLISGCVTAPTPATAPAAASIDVSGKLGVRTASDGFSASLRYQQFDDAFRIELWGLLGQGRTLIEGDAQRIGITNARGELVASGEPERVMLQELGWSLPLAVLRYWVAGQPDPDQPVAAGGGGVDSRYFKQRGWAVTAKRLAPVDGVSLPGLLVLQRGSITARIALREWHRYERPFDPWPSEPAQPLSERGR
ncbi:MAG: outer membrane lipoprotein LolB [Pseudomonadaceae bacterium]|nr:outer membrane lipoprotein LolB [Pseudomonadaceae bacterium]